MWPFGGKKEPADETRCASCGRTLLAGEWTQRMVQDDDREVLICSLCSQSRSTQSAPVETATAESDPRSPVDGRETKRRSDAFWRALKEKDAEIEDLRARLEHTETEKEGLLAELAILRGASEFAFEGSEPEAAETAGGTAAELEGAEALEAAPELQIAAATAAVSEAAPEPEAAAIREAQSEPDAEAPDEVAEALTKPAADEAPEGDVEDTLPGTLSADEVRGERLVAEGDAELAAQAAGTPAGGADLDSGDEYLTDEELHLVQRGVDILNVSAVPRKIAETSQSLGVPFVHVAILPDASIGVTYAWPLGWYRFAVTTEGSGSVSLAERGYEELAELQPNGTVRSDGTVQLAPTFGKRPTPKEETAADVEPSVSTASVTSGVIISKSLMGQRTDDEAVVPWEGQNARDFDWGR